ncbi:MAG: hypothetical protein NC332_01460, partial [Firmicutes bacterium]|nr:hypothetical protein [Bacillota bacterium]
VVRAVANSEKPIVSAVGHGVDYTLCDFAADIRAVTPSEAAEFVTLDSAVAKRKIIADLSSIRGSMESKVKSYFDRIAYDSNRIGLIAERTLDNVRACICANISACMLAAERGTEKAQVKLEKNLARMESINPLNVLKRGYCYASNDNGVIKSVSDVQADSLITLTLRDGTVRALVKDKEQQ